MSDFAYTARHTCGHIVAASVDSPDYRKETAKEVARWIKDGDDVERLRVEEVRATIWCKCFDKREAKQNKPIKKAAEQRALL